METKKIISKIGTLVVVGATSTAGAALWTNVLCKKIQLAEAKRTHSDKVIVVDFRKGRGELGR